MKAVWTLTLFGLCVCAPVVSAQDPEPTAGAEPAAAKAALVEEIRDRIVWYDEEKGRPLFIPEEVFGLLSLDELPIRGYADSIRLWIARQEKERSADEAAIPCPYPGTVSRRLTPGKKRLALEEAMVAPLAVLLVKVDRTRVGIRPDLGLEACSPPLGTRHGHCVKDSGFEVEIDSTVLPEGPGRRSLVSTTNYGWTTSLELDLVVANRSE